MRILFIVICLFVSFFNVSAQIDLCETVDVLRYESIPICVSPGRFLFGYETQIDDVNYHVVLNKQKKIEFISTSDTAFSFCGIGVGTTYFDIPAQLIKSERPDYGWGYEVTFNNGWTAVFADVLVYKSLRPYRKSKINWFYKATDCKEYTTVLE